MLDAADAAARELGPHDVAIVLGSGWTEAVADLPCETDVPLASLPGFAQPTVAGHGASARSLRAGDVRVLAFTGRHHYYESRDVGLVAHAVRTAAAAGCRAVVLTSASGGMRDNLGPGDIVLVSDHVNLTGASPLVGGRFLDLTDLYSPRLRALCRDLDPSLSEGVYVCYWGPNYETPAEIAPTSIWAGTSSGCRRYSRRSPRRTPAWRCSPSPSSRTARQGSAVGSTTQRCSRPPQPRSTGCGRSSAPCFRASLRSSPQTP